MDDTLLGAEYVSKVLNGNEDRCPDTFRMEQHVFTFMWSYLAWSNMFLLLCGALKQRNLNMIPNIYPWKCN